MQIILSKTNKIAVGRSISGPLALPLRFYLRSGEPDRSFLMGVVLS
jgi:hypothetical protein